MIPVPLRSCMRFARGARVRGKTSRPYPRRLQPNDPIMTYQPQCAACQHSEQRQDLVLWCKVQGVEAARPCRFFRYEPGSDADEPREE